MAFRPDDPDAWLRTYYGEDLAELTIYDQNTPGIVEKCRAAAAEGAETELALHEIINLMRVPQAGFIIPALERVQPKTIIELGVGGNMGASTSVFLRWCEKAHAKLWSCDRTDPGLTMERYRPYLARLWSFRQCDSCDFLRSFDDRLEVDMIFIDTIHSYDHTVREMELSSAWTNAILLDDAEYPGFRDGIDGRLEDLSPLDREDHGSSEPGGVKRAIADFLDAYTNWRRVDVGHPNVALLLREAQ